MNARTKPSILMGRLANLAEQISDLESTAQDETDLNRLASLRSEQSRIHHNLKMNPLTGTA